jgi:hypothetical protein
MKKHLRQREQFCVLLCCFVGFLTFSGRNCQAAEAARPSTFCNPLNLPYRFSLESPSGLLIENYAPDVERSSEARLGTEGSRMPRCRVRGGTLHRGIVDDEAQ